MKALSLWNPWAVLLVAGKKCVETRGWPITHRGPLLIHAAKKWSRELADLCHRGRFFADALQALGMTIPPAGGQRTPTPSNMPFGEIVGRVDVVDCFPTDRVSVSAADDFVRVASGLPHDRTLVIGRKEEAFGDYSPGRFAFLCTNPVRFEKPIPFRGLQGLFEVPDELAPAERR